MVVTISLGGFVADQMRYNLESAQYVIELLYIMTDKYVLVFIYIQQHGCLSASMLLNIYKN